MVGTLERVMEGGQEKVYQVLGLVLLLTVGLGTLVRGQTLNCEPTVFQQEDYLKGYQVTSTSIANNLAIVGFGANAFPGSGDSSGSGSEEPGVAIVYEYDSSSGAWEETQRFQGSSGVSNQSFAYSVAITNRILSGVGFIGIPSEDRVLVIAKNPATGVWEELANLTTGSEAYQGSGFGSSLAIGVASSKAGSKLQVLVVGAPKAMNDNGAAFIFTNDTSNDSWPPANFSLYQVLDNPTFINTSLTPSTSSFGASVAIANSGTNLVVGSPSWTDSSAPGAAYVYTRFVAPPPNSTTPPSPFWELAFSLPSDVVGLLSAPGDLFGASVGTWGSTYEDATNIYNEQAALVGIPGRSAVYLFNTNSYPVFNLTYNQTIFDPRLSSASSSSTTPTGFGWSVASNNNYPGGCILPIVGSPSWSSSSSSSSSSTLHDADEARAGVGDGVGAVYAYMYQTSYGNPWLLDKNLTALSQE